MSDIERVREWIKGFGGIPEEFKIDFTSEIPSNAGIFPNGLVEISRRPDILDNITVTNQYNFSIYYVFEKDKGEDSQALSNADWVMAFQKWVQEQSVRHLAPSFGNVDIEQETFKAQNGAMFEASKEGTAMYMVLLSAQFKNFYGG